MSIREQIENGRMQEGITFYNAKGSLLDYATNKIPTGGFLRAVLSNNLSEAVGRADVYNRQIIPELVEYIYNNLPGSCWGSYEAVDKWLKTNKNGE